jgi:hypothetical protein
MNASMTAELSASPMRLVLDVERRESPRRRCLDQQAVSWRAGFMSLRRHGGWLYDVSDEGLSFVATAADAPRPGQTLDLTRESDGQRFTCTVVRHERLSDGRKLVGCRLIEATPMHRPMVEVAMAA